MKKITKKVVATLTAILTLITGMTGFVSSAANVDTKSVTATAEGTTRTSTHSYRFSNVGTSDAYASGDVITLTTSTTIKISFGAATPAQALVTVVSSSDVSETYGSFIMPTYTQATLYTSFTLPSGSYRFYVTPYNGTSTSGAFTVSK